MNLDIQKTAIRRLLETQSTDLYNKLLLKFFSDSDLLIFRRIQRFYIDHMRVPSVQEMYEQLGPAGLQEYFKTHILSEETNVPQIDSNFLSELLQDYHIREETISWLDKFLNQLEHLERSEIIDQFQNHILELHKFIPDGEELFDVGNLALEQDKDRFVMLSSGLSAEYDALNGGFGLQELVMFGGRRGSGKSIISLNALKHQYMKNDVSVAFFSIEMRYIEVYYRLMSMLSRVPFMRFLKSELTNEDKQKVAEAKLTAFYQPTEEGEKLLKGLADNNYDLKKFDASIKALNIPLKEKRFFIIDNVNLSIPNIDHHLNVLSKKHNIRASVVDYLNIVHTEDRMDWKSQISLADGLKMLSRKYEQVLMTPYQIDESGEARFAKGVLDSADRSFRFTPADLTNNPNVLPFETTKIRNGKAIKFDVHMDWDCLSVIPESSVGHSAGKILNKYGHDSKEGAADVG